ncbi:MAG: hypothetical protein AB8C95_00585 [Phycisphaeraceae bacterium]
MSVQTQQFRVVGVNTQSGKDVSVVIDAASKAAAEVKAEKMHIETTHIVRLKADTPQPPDEHELFSAEAAEALAGQRTINLVEECVSHEESKATPAEAAASAESHPRNPKPETPAPKPASPEPEQVFTAISRPSYAAPSSQRDNQADQVSGMRAFALVLVVLLGISAGAYFVLVHQPNSTIAQDEDLIFGQDLFSDVLEPATTDQSNDAMRDAFNNRTASAGAKPNNPPIALDQQLRITAPTEAASAVGSTNPPKLTLQSIVTTNKGRFAVINGKLYEQGHSIGTAKLVSVADDWVLIEREGKQFTLQIAKNN